MQSSSSANTGLRFGGDQLLDGTGEVVFDTAANNVVLGGRNTVLCPSWGPPFVTDLDQGRRYATFEDFQKLVKLHHTLPHLHHSGGV